MRGNVYTRKVILRGAVRRSRRIHPLPRRHRRTRCRLGKGMVQIWSAGIAGIQLRFIPAYNSNPLHPIPTPSPTGTALAKGGFWGVQATHTQAGRLRSHVHAFAVVPAGRLDSLSFPRRREFRGNDEKAGTARRAPTAPIPVSVRGGGSSPSGAAKERRSRRSRGAPFFW